MLNQIAVCVGLLFIVGLLIYFNILSRLDAFCCCCKCFKKDTDNVKEQTQNLINKRNSNILDDYNSL